MEATEEAMSDASEAAVAAAAAAAPPAAAAAAALPAATAAPKPRPSALQRAKDRVAAHVSTVGALQAAYAGDAHVELADASLRSLEAMLHGRCVPSVEIARLHRLSYEFSESEDPRTRALMLMGGALRSMSVARNEHITMGHGFEPDEFGLPKLRVKPNKYYRESDENISPRGTPSVVMQQLEEEEMEMSPPPMQLQQPRRRVKREPLWEGEVVEEEEEEADGRQSWYTRGSLTGATSHRNASNRPPVRRARSEEGGEQRMGLPRREEREPKQYHPLAPAPKFEYKRDAAGNVLVKSEMLGDDEFFDHQLQMRELGNRYEAIARTGVFEERFIMRQLTGEGGRVGKYYECDECGEICTTQHKFAAHKRYSHPKNGETRSAKRAERAKTAALSSLEPAVVRQKRERRAPVPRDEMVAHSPAVAPANKIYTCPMCAEVCDSQHKFASHMRYKHPKSSVEESMVGRRAAVTKIGQTDSPSLTSAPSPLFASSSSSSSSSMTASASSSAVATPPVCSYSVGKAASMTSTTTPSNGASSSKMTTTSKTAAVIGDDGEAMFPCKLCGRLFASVVKLGGHTGHCRAAHAAGAAAAAAPAAGGAASTMTASPATTTPKTTASAKREKEGKRERTLTMKMKEKGEEEDEEEGETPKKTYKCLICGRKCDNYNSLAGHTRHCRNARDAAAAAATAAASPAAPAASEAAAAASNGADATTAVATPAAAAEEASKMTPSAKKEKAEGEKPQQTYACNLCSSAFDSASYLAVHTRHCRNETGAAVASRLAATGVAASPAALAAIAAAEGAVACSSKTSSALNGASSSKMTTTTPKATSSVRKELGMSRVRLTKEKEDLWRARKEKEYGVVRVPNDGWPKKATSSAKREDVPKVRLTKDGEDVWRTRTPKLMDGWSKEKREEESDEEQKEEREAHKKSYTCHICGRLFDNYNAVAGHTRHCMAKNGIDPSPRALHRRHEKERKEQAAAAASPLAAAAADKGDTAAAGAAGHTDAAANGGETAAAAAGNTRKPVQQRKRAASVFVRREEKEMGEEDGETLKAAKKEGETAAAGAAAAASAADEQAVPPVFMMVNKVFAAERYLSPSLSDATLTGESEGEEEEMEEGKEVDTSELLRLPLPSRLSGGVERKGEGREAAKPVQQRKRAASVFARVEERKEKNEGGTPKSAKKEKETAAATPVLARGKVVGPLTMSTRHSSRAARASIGISDQGGVVTPTSSPSVLTTAILVPPSTGEESMGGDEQAVPSPVKRARTDAPPTPIEAPPTSNEAPPTPIAKEESMEGRIAVKRDDDEEKTGSVRSEKMENGSAK